MRAHLDSAAPLSGIGARLNRNPTVSDNSTNEQVVQGTEMGTELASRLMRGFAWPDVELVEGTEAVLWPADGPEAALAEDLPPADQGALAVLSWARAKVLRFETASPEPLPTTLLVSTLAVGGPARFVVHKSYQVGATAVCDPPSEVMVVERRDLFRVPVVTDVSLSFHGGSFPGFTLDCSIGGLRAVVPRSVPVGNEVEVELALGPGKLATLPATARHCRVGTPAVVGLQFERVSADMERQLSQFVGFHQRRLMPRVKAVVPVEYSSHGRPFIEAFASDVSPGDVCISAFEAHLPGEPVEVRVFLARRQHSFRAHVLSSEMIVEEGAPTRHVLRLSFGEADVDAETQFRKAVRELAIDRVSRRDDT